MNRIWPYHFTDYDSKGRFCSYWHQINEVVTLNPERVLEVGVGSGFVSDYLKAKGINVTTIDIDERLNPDVVGSVLEIPLPKASFDAVSCCEVLEHLPYEDFRKALSELLRVSNSHVVLTVPDIRRVWRLKVRIPSVGQVRKLIPFPMMKKPTGSVSEEPHPKEADAGYSLQHYWEIGKAGYPLRRVIADIKKSGFEIERTYRVFEFVYHHFFILQKRIG